MKVFQIIPTGAIIWFVLSALSYLLLTKPVNWKMVVYFLLGAAINAVVTYWKG